MTSFQEMGLRIEGNLEIIIDSKEEGETVAANCAAKTIFGVNRETPPSTFFTHPNLQRSATES